MKSLRLPLSREERALQFSRASSLVGNQRKRFSRCAPDLEAEAYGLLDFTIEAPFGRRLTFGSELDAKDMPPPS